MLDVVEHTMVGVVLAVPRTRTPVPQQWSEAHFLSFPEQSAPAATSVAVRRSKSEVASALVAAIKKARTTLLYILINN